MPSCCATRRAAPTSPPQQNPQSCAPPHNFLVAATHSLPFSTSMAAATDESTPPERAARTRTSATRADGEAEPAHRVDHGLDAPVDVRVARGPPERQTQRTAGVLLRDAHRGEHVRRLQRTAGAR